MPKLYIAKDLLLVKKTLLIYFLVGTYLLDKPHVCEYFLGLIINLEINEDKNY